MKAPLVRVWPDRFFNQPPKEIVQAGELHVLAERLRDSNLRKTECKTQEHWNKRGQSQNDRAPAQRKHAEQKERCRDEIERDRDSKKHRGQNSPKPFRLRFGLSCRSNQRENSADHRQHHHAIEMRRPREAVDDKRIPCVPCRAAIAISPAN